jgi:hypothetical protein
MLTLYFITSMRTSTTGETYWILAIGIILLAIAYAMRVWERRQRRKEFKEFNKRWFKGKDEE